MHIYLKNNPDKFHPDPIWNDGVLGFFEERRPNKNKNKMSSEFLIQQTAIYIWQKSVKKPARKVQKCTPEQTCICSI